MVSVQGCGGAGSRPGGVKVQLTGQDPDLVVPITALRVPADQLAAPVDRYGAARR